MLENTSFKKVVYISHPYQDMEKNVEDCDRITLKLMSENPDILFINPLRAFCWSYNDMEYYRGLEYCYGLLSLCDEMWVCENWQSSVGCNGEIEYAQNNGIVIKYINKEGNFINE